MDLRCLPRNHGKSLHHTICYTFRGQLHLPYAETHSIVLPHVVAYDAPNIPKVWRRLAAALPDRDGDAILGLNALLRKLDVKT